MEKLLQIPIKKKFGEKYSGQYSYQLNANGGKILDGDFYFSCSDSGYYFTDAFTKKVDSSMFQISKIKYTGRFLNNKKSGQFSEEFLTDDGVDIYSNWHVTIKYDKDECDSATFFGVIGSEMPESKYTFQHLDTCTFDRVVNLAWTEWEKIWKQRNDSINETRR